MQDVHSDMAFPIEFLSQNFRKALPPKSPELIEPSSSHHQQHP